jgi:hypothetical protein
MPLLSLSETPGEFLDVAGADQVALGGVIAWWERPVAAGRMAAPDPPPRVEAPEPVKLVIPAADIPASGHRWCLLMAGAVGGGTWSSGRRPAVQRLLPAR